MQVLGSLKLPAGVKSPWLSSLCRGRENGLFCSKNYCIWAATAPRLVLRARSSWGGERHTNKRAGSSEPEEERPAPRAGKGRLVVIPEQG